MDKPAHSLYTTDDRGVNELALREFSFCILAREHVRPVFPNHLNEREESGGADQHNHQWSRCGFNDLHDEGAHEAGYLAVMTRL
jgi:hypothetical protein